MSRPPLASRASRRTRTMYANRVRRRGSRRWRREGPQRMSPPISAHMSIIFVLACGYLVAQARATLSPQARGQHHSADCCAREGIILVRARRTLVSHTYLHHLPLDAGRLATAPACSYCGSSEPKRREHGALRSANVASSMRVWVQLSCILSPRSAPRRCAPNGFVYRLCSWLGTARVAVHADIAQWRLVRQPVGGLLRDS